MITRRVQRQQGPPDGVQTILDVPRADEKAAPEPDLPANPMIGRGLRWYDGLYRLLRAIQAVATFLRLPARWRTKIHGGINYLFQLHHARESRMNPRIYSLDVIEIPEGEGVTLPYAWVVEYFPASDIDALYGAIRKFGWDGPRFSGGAPGGARSVMSGRQGQGGTWWRIAELRSMRSRGYVPVDGQRVRLPRGIGAIDLVGVPIGKGLTAVVVSFSLDESVSNWLNEVLTAHYRHEVIRWRGRMAASQPPPYVLYHHAQRARAHVHRRLRRWMRRTLPGAFARYRKPHPLFDVMFFNRASPELLGADGPGYKNDALRAMGLRADPVTRVTSNSLPGMLLDQRDFGEWAPEISDNTWAFWGNRSAIDGLTRMTGNHGANAAGFFLGDRSTDFMARRGLTSLLHAMREDASATHDNARKLHGGTRSRDLRRLRNRILTTSVDLATLGEDVKEYNGRRWRDREPQFYYDYSPAFKARDLALGHKPIEPIDVNRGERKTQRRLARELVSFDAKYRDVLNTVASLGTSLDSRRVQRLAVYVSVASLGVAVVTLWATQTPPPDLLPGLCGVLRELGVSAC
ncbi:hypothetical protein B0I12_000792 [Microbacterium hydrothermale]|uniref:hypothetical protein n=1 Tax=Microbacterium hydrothermale TaxID=857427 RepID=UPI002226045B|nr:hypothetical protein [Microbacterium hydrothermale]MCW2163666.1 hypothetical protein [Microbacterium hydrothermale]